MLLPVSCIASYWYFALPGPVSRIASYWYFALPGPASRIAKAEPVTGKTGFGFRAWALCR
ncbi:MAG: hypothetical protein KDA95_09140 [Acidimicrobiales bacterium]|nr:hypothetical protein [Acidimicrobiales bacterium]